MAVPHRHHKLDQSCNKKTANESSSKKACVKYINFASIEKLRAEINFSFLIETLVTCTAAYCYVDEAIRLKKPCTIIMLLNLIISNFIKVCISIQTTHVSNPILVLKAKQVYSLSFYVQILSPTN